MTYTKLPQGEYDKAVGQLRLQFNGVFRPFHMHGLGIHVPNAIEECIHLSVQFSIRMRGEDIPIERKR